jgi:hypothetical protein
MQSTRRLPGQFMVHATEQKLTCHYEKVESAMTRDRKDLPPPGEDVGQQPVETPEQRDARKDAESASLDQALEETSPASDPISPFVPAIGSVDRKDDTTQAPESSAVASVACGHTRCRCLVQAPEIWCSETCRDQQQGFDDADDRCNCDHEACTHV